MTGVAGKVLVAGWRNYLSTGRRSSCLCTWHVSDLNSIGTDLECRQLEELTTFSMVLGELAADT
jgi:hypothetical protein